MRGLRLLAVVIMAVFGQVRSELTQGEPKDDDARFKMVRRACDR